MAYLISSDIGAEQPVRIIFLPLTEENWKLLQQITEAVEEAMKACNMGDKTKGERYLTNCVLFKPEKRESLESSLGLETFEVVPEADGIVQLETISIQGLLDALNPQMQWSTVYETRPVQALYAVTKVMRYFMQMHTLLGCDKKCVGNLYIRYARAELPRGLKETSPAAILQDVKIAGITSEVVFSDEGIEMDAEYMSTYRGRMDQTVARLNGTIETLSACKERVGSYLSRIVDEYVKDGKFGEETRIGKDGQEPIFH